jgi:hypothetical protein
MSASSAGTVGAETGHGAPSGSGEGIGCWIRRKSEIACLEARSTKNIQTPTFFHVLLLVFAYFHFRNNRFNHSFGFT